MLKICAFQLNAIKNSILLPRAGKINIAHFTTLKTLNLGQIIQDFRLRAPKSGLRNILKDSKEFAVKCKCYYHSGPVLRSKAKKLLPFETETRVAKDIMIFKNENGTFFKVVSAFGIAQLIFWQYLANFALQSTKDISRDEEAELVERHRESHPKTVLFWEWVNFGDNKYRYGIAMAFGAVGYFVALGAFLYTMRSVKYLVLLKGGEFMRVITYAPFGARRITVPLSYISGQHALSTTKPYYAFKIKGYWFNFLVDMKGQLLEQKLFENTIGVDRSIKKKK